MHEEQVCMMMASLAAMRILANRTRVQPDPATEAARLEREAMRLEHEEKLRLAEEQREREEMERAPRAYRRRQQKEARKLGKQP